jgi:hypothetical protein
MKLSRIEARPGLYFVVAGFMKSSPCCCSAYDYELIQRCNAKGYDL